MEDQQANPQTRKRKPRTGPGRPAANESLTPKEVAEAALRLIREEGEGALTMRRLGEVLGVKAMALYNHFRDKEAILDAVASIALAQLPAAPAKGAWRTRIKAVCQGIRKMALESPNLFRVAMTRPTPPNSPLLQIESILSALADAGLAPGPRAVAYHTLRLFVRAHCLWELEELGKGGDPAELARLSAPYPHASASMDLLFTPEPDRRFEAGIDLILRGLQSSKGR